MASEAAVSASLVAAPADAPPVGSSWATDPDDSVPAYTAPASVRYATKSPPVATSSVPDGAAVAVRRPSASRSTGTASSMRTTLASLSVNMYELSVVETMRLGLLTVRTVSSSSIAVLTRA